MPIYRINIDELAPSNGPDQIVLDNALYTVSLDQFRGLLRRTLQATAGAPLLQGTGEYVEPQVTLLPLRITPPGTREEPASAAAQPLLGARVDWVRRHVQLLTGMCIPRDSIRRDAGLQRFFDPTCRLVRERVSGHVARAWVRYARRVDTLSSGWLAELLERCCSRRRGILGEFQRALQAERNILLDGLRTVSADCLDTWVRRCSRRRRGNTTVQTSADACYLLVHNRHIDRADWAATLARFPVLCCSTELPEPEQRLLRRTIEERCSN